MTSLVRTSRIRKTKWAFAAVIVLFLVLLLWAAWWEPSSLTVVRQTITVRPWHVEHAGLKVAVISDLHVGSPYRDLKKLKQLVEIVNHEKPDLVLILGDYLIRSVLGGSFVEPEPIAGELAELQAPLGVVSILGNHDWWFDGNRMRRALEAHGIRVLEDENLSVVWHGQSFWLSGLADLWTRGDHLQATLSQIQNGDPIIVLMHNPDLFPRMPRGISLSLAGHTHGGQVNLPFIGRPLVPSKYNERYAHGLIEENGKQLFVTSGVGTSIVPIRFRVPPEVVILTLIPQSEN